MKKYQLLRGTIGFQGVYYLVTSAWAIASLNSFTQVVNRTPSPFEMYTIAAILFVIGVLLIASSVLDRDIKLVGFFTVGITVAIALVELVYIQQISNSLLMVDFFEELVIAGGISFLLYKVKVGEAREECKEDLEKEKSDKKTNIDQTLEDIEKKKKGNEKKS